MKNKSKEKQLFIIYFNTHSDKKILKYDQNALKLSFKSELFLPPTFLSPPQKKVCIYTMKDVSTTYLCWQDKLHFKAKPKRTARNPRN